MRMTWGRSGIYTITCTPSGRSYIGSAKDFAARWWQHRRALRDGKHHSIALQRAWNRYGEEEFVFSRLLVCAPSDLIFYEQRAFDILRPQYNCAKVAGSQLGYKMSAEARAKMSAKAKARPFNKEAFAKGLAKRIGQKRSVEFRAQISAMKKALVMTPERLARMARVRSLRGQIKDSTRQKISESLKGNTHTLGYNHTPETRAKMSKTRTGMKRAPFSAEWCHNISLAKKGRTKKSRAMELSLPLADLQIDVPVGGVAPSVGRSVPASRRRSSTPIVQPSLFAN